MSKLYIVPTPIGNLEDITLRAIRVLKEVDFILAEDTRTSAVLLKHLGIEKPLRSHHKFNEHATVAMVADSIEQGKDVALISDAGTPGISDPGFLLVRTCVERGIEVSTLPGATAFVPALVQSGFPCDRFCFEGFLSTAKKSRREHLDSLSGETRTMIFYEAPHKLVNTLEDMIAAFGADRGISLCRELTKLHEEVIRTTLGGAIELYTQQPPKGEFVLVVAGAAPQTQEAFTPADAARRVAELMESGMSRKDAVKQTAAEMDLPKNVVYDAALEIE